MGPTVRERCPFNKKSPERSRPLPAAPGPPLGTARAHAPARPPPRAPAPARAARAGAGRWRRCCCRPRGASRLPTARGPRRGAGAHDRPGIAPLPPTLPPPAPVSGFPESLFPEHSAGRLRESRRDERSPLQPQLVWPGPKHRMGLPLQGPLAAKTDTVPLLWGQDAS